MKFVGGKHSILRVHKKLAQNEKGSVALHPDISTGPNILTFLMSVNMAEIWYAIELRVNDSEQLEGLDI